MNTLEKKFEKMGARCKVNVSQPRRFVRNSGNEILRIDVRKDKEGTYFDILKGDNIEVSVLDVQPKDRHLLLMARTQSGEKSKWLMGHDERDWFVAAVPENRPVSSVQTAKQALKPTAVVAAEERVGVKPGKRQKRKNEARKRQGEWFLVPVSNLKVDEKLILKNEPLRRGRGKPHMAEELYRVGGETVYVGIGYPNGISVKAYENMSVDERKNKNFRPMTRNPKVYVRGAIRHSDHKTLKLDCWHEVYLNTESESFAMKHLAFLD